MHVELNTCNRAFGGRLRRRLRGAAFDWCHTLPGSREKSSHYQTSGNGRLPETSPRVDIEKDVRPDGTATNTLEDVASSGDVRGSRLPTRFTLANAKFDEYGSTQVTLQSGSAPAPIPRTGSNYPTLSLTCTAIPLSVGFRDHAGPVRPSHQLSTHLHYRSLQRAVSLLHASGVAGVVTSQ